MDDRVQAKPKPRARWRPPFGLAARVLGLIIAFVMLAEIAIFIPSIANFRNSWLTTRLSAAYTAALVLEAAPKGMVPDPLKQALLDSVGARMIVLKTHDMRRILAASDMPPDIDEMDDLRSFSPAASIMSAFRSLFGRRGRILDVRAAAPMGAEFIEVAMDEAPLKAAMRTYSVNILLLSLAISLFVASLAALSLHYMVLAPVRRLTNNLVDFASAPQDTSKIIVPAGSSHEIGAAEHALADMETALARELREKKRLADLGLAVAKINHDLRNMLAAAQLLSDRLATAADPFVAHHAPKLVATLDRAIRFCQTTLVYGRSVDEPPKLALIDLHPIAIEAMETAVASAKTTIEARQAVPQPMHFEADSEQIFRVLHNLCRNAVDALEQGGAADDHEPCIRIEASRVADRIVIRVSDTGKGLPMQARRNLFVPFQGSAKSGGTGLGLAIASDLVIGHGGAIRLLDADPSDKFPGACFEIDLPAKRALA